MLTLYEVDKSSTKTIRVSNGMRDLFEFNIEFYHNDNMLFPDFDLEYPYKFEINDSISNKFGIINSTSIISYNSLMTVYETKYNKKRYWKKLKLKDSPKKVETGELLLYFCNNNLQLLHKKNLILTKFGCVIEEDNGNLFVRFVDNHSTKNTIINKADFTLIEEFNLNKIFNLTILIKVGSFNQIDTIYYTTDCVIKNEMLL